MGQSRSNRFFNTQQVDRTPGAVQGGAPLNEGADAQRVTNPNAYKQAEAPAEGSSEGSAIGGIVKGAVKDALKSGVREGLAPGSGTVQKVKKDIGDILPGDNAKESGDKPGEEAATPEAPQPSKTGGPSNRPGALLNIGTLATIAATFVLGVSLGVGELRQRFPLVRVRVWLSSSQISRWFQLI